jgi:polysaccharide biosynthesis protein PelA
MNGSTDPRIAAVPASRALNFAFYYGAHVPVAELSAFDTVVVEPDSGFDPKAIDTPHTAWMAYVSVGEVNVGRTYFKDIPKAWLRGENKAWGSVIVDQSTPQWPKFYVEHVIAPLWDRGFHGFFLDTLDSYQVEAKTDAERALQQAGIIAVIQAIKSRYPSARVILNRGFELLPQVHDQVYAVAFESLYRSWNQAEQRYLEVAPADREWLLMQVQATKAYGLPIVAIDYCPPGDMQCARDTAAKIRALGVIPYVTAPSLDIVGVGSIEVKPRRILVVQDSDPHADLAQSDGFRYLGMPINYLGYYADYINAADHLPQQPLNDRYAGVVLWMNRSRAHSRALGTWLSRKIDEGMRVAVIASFGTPLDRVLEEKLDLQPVTGSPHGVLRVASSDPSLIGFEVQPQPDAHDYVAVRVGPSGRSLLRLKAGDFEIDAAAITRWGGYVMRPFVVFQMGETNQARWVMQPITFLQQALRLPAMPVPDTTTEAGRRLLMSHIDGDGFGLRAEFGNTQQGAFAGDVLLGILRKYGWPTTVSVTEGELSDDGPYQANARTLRAIARRIFALPNVEIASHTYTQPTQWARTGSAANENRSDSGAKQHWLAVDIPGYHFSIDREIAGSAAFIGRELAPSGKPVKMLLWSGDCAAPAAALKAAYDARLMNMNGGETVITKRDPSWTAISPLGVMREGYYQVFAPNQSEERYTRYWQGPYYGFERVLETFDMTDHPMRFKPIDVHYHMYGVTKYASVAALERVYAALASQRLNPVFTSEYAKKVLDFFNFSIARDGDTWLLRDSGQLRTVRLAPGDAPDLATSTGIAGYIPGPAGVYVHLSASEARINVLHGEAATHANASLPYLADANGRVERFVRHAHGISFDLRSHVAPSFRLANVRSCRVTANGQLLTPGHSGNGIVHVADSAPFAPSGIRAADEDASTEGGQTGGRLSSYAVGPAAATAAAAGQLVHVDVDCAI